MTASGGVSVRARLEGLTRSLDDAVLGRFAEVGCDAGELRAALRELDSKTAIELLRRLASRLLEEETKDQFDQARNAAVDMEDRYGVRAPELTTEEFLHEARKRRCYKFSK